MNESEWEEWKAQPSTKAFFRFLKDRYEQAKEDWASGAFDGDMANEFAFKQAHALGGVKALADIIQTNHEDLESE